MLTSAPEQLQCVQAGAQTAADVTRQALFGPKLDSLEAFATTRTESK